VSRQKGPASHRITFQQSKRTLNGVEKAIRDSRVICGDPERMFGHGG
jgi:hypothetical protein